MKDKTIEYEINNKQLIITIQYPTEYSKVVEENIEELEDYLSGFPILIRK